MPAVLQILNGKSVGTKYPIAKDVTRIGRHPDCEVVVDLSAASRFHAHVLREGGVYQIEDLGSRNKTFVNGKPIEGRVSLHDNDRVKICDALFLFKSGEEELDDDEGSTVLATVGSQISLESLKVKPEAKLRAILEINAASGSELTLDGLLPKMLESLFKIFPQADRAMVILHENDRLIPRAARHRRADEDNVRFSRTIARQSMESRSAMLSADAQSDSRFSLSSSLVDMRIRSVMCAPLCVSEKPAFGVMVVDTQSSSQRFENEDLQILTAVANQAAIAIDNSQLYAESLAKERLNRELQLARDVQRSFLPQGKLEATGLDLWAYYEAAGAVGGDYYDYFILPNGKIAILLGDVSGKGVPAALLMAKASSEAKVALLTMPDDIAGAVGRLNNAICDANLEGRFMTLALCVVDPITFELVIVNAGHMSPVIRRAATGVLEEPADPDVSGLPIGVSADYPYEAVSTSLDVNDTVVIYSDGISEAMNETGEEFNTDRLRTVVSTGGKCANDVGDSLLVKVQKHVDGWKQHDDMTLVVFCRK